MVSILNDKFSLATLNNSVEPLLKGIVRRFGAAIRYKAWVLYVFITYMHECSVYLVFDCAVLSSRKLFLLTSKEEIGQSLNNGTET